MKKIKFITVSLSLALVITGAGAALAAKIGNQPMTTVEDVIAATGTNPVLKKDSLLIVSHDRSSGQIAFSYARFSDDYKLEVKNKTLFTKNTSAKTFKLSGLHPAVSKNYTTSTVPPAITMVDHLFENKSTYAVNLWQVSKDNNSINVTEKTPINITQRNYSALQKDVADLKGGIFATGNNREIFAALQWADAAENSVILDFFSVAQGAGEMKFEKSQNVAVTNPGNGNIFARMAVGDINGDGYANEIAVFTNCKDQWKYSLYVYQVSWKGSALEINTLVDAKEIYSHALGKYNTNRDIWFLKAAGDVAVADFNGDGRNEIALIYKGYNEDLPKDLDSDLNNIMGPVYVKLYQYNATLTSRLAESKTAAKKSFSSVGAYKGDIRYLRDLGDLKAVAADVDGDGKYELAMLGLFWEADFEKNRFSRDTLTQGMWTPRLHLWRYSEPASNTAVTDVPARLNMKYDKQIAEFANFYYSSSKCRTMYLAYDSDSKIGGSRTYVTGRAFTEPMFQIIAGVFSGTSTTQKPCEDIIVSHAKHITSTGTGYVKAFCPVLDNDGKFKEFKQIDIITDIRSDTITLGLAAGDFVGDGVLLKNPYHFYHDGRSIFTSVIQALPYHIDYIPLPWEKNGKPKLTNFTYVPGGQVSYVRTNETKTKNSVSTTSNSTYEMKTKVGASVSWSPTDFIPFVPANPDAKFSPRFSLLLEGNANYTGKDTATKLESSVETTKTTETIQSTAVDSIMAYSVRHHTWRYPIDPVPEWYKSRSKDITSDGKFSYTVTMTEAPKSHKSRIGYNARHEEGNLFSYPTKMDNIPDFTNAKTKILTEAVDYRLEPGEYSKEVEITMSKEKENNVTAEHTWQAGFNFQFMYGNYGIGKSGAKVDTDHQWSWGGSRNKLLNSTFTKGEKLSVKFADPSATKGMEGIVINNVAFLTTYQAYINPNGLMKMGFAVNLQGGSSPVPMLWRESVYNVSTDPAFVLPNKFAVQRKTIAVNPDKLDATSVRGVELYALSGDQQIILNAPFFAKGESYMLSFPIYNASFVDAPAFKVRLSYAPFKDRKNPAKFTKIGEVTISALKGWTMNTENNKTYASFKFKVPESAAFGDNVFLAEIDPDNEIKEVHEEWSEKIPGGNNTGIFIFPIMDANGRNPGNTSKRITASDVKTSVKIGKPASVQTADNESYTPLEWTPHDTGRELYDYIMSQSEPVEIRLSIDYLADSETGLTLFEIVKEFEDDGEIYDEVYDEGAYYVVADEDNQIDYEFYFLISSEDLKDGRSLRLDISDLDDLTSDDAIHITSIPLTVSPYDPLSSGGGCNSGLTLLSLILAAGLLYRVKVKMEED